MKKVLGFVLAFGVAAGLSLADPVAPANLPLVCLRNTGTSGNVTNTVFWQGDTISFTNSVMYTGSTTNTPQNLADCVITVTMGSLTSTNVTTATGSSIVTNEGTWFATMAVPAFNPCYIQVSVSNENVFTYPLYRISTQAKLGE